jgi:uncharacterized protein YbaR (Trm112 family)
MALSPDLLAVLACPESKEPLLYFAGGEAGNQPEAAFLLCAASRLRYRIEDEVPVMLVEEAERLEARDVERLVNRARELGIRGSGDRA